MTEDKLLLFFNNQVTCSLVIGLNEEKVLSGFKALKLTSRFKEFNPFKMRGYSFTLILSHLICMVVSNQKTVHGYLSDALAKNVDLGKDSFYRLKNNEKINWRMILWRISMLFLNITGDEADSLPLKDAKPRYLIFDDSVLEKAGRRMEFIGHVWDHVKQRSVLGFKLLTMTYWDGVCSIPLDFSFHREKGKNLERPYGMKKKELARQFSRKRVMGSDSHRRMKELDKSKIEMVLKMFYCAIYRCVKVDYVLVDSWFTCQALIQAVRSVRDGGVHLIGMYKIAKTKFMYEGELLTYGQINNKAGKAKRCRSLGYYYKRADVTYDGMPIVLFFSRRSKRDKWKVLLTTDPSLGFIKLLEHYSVRWTVEVFYRESKQLLNLGKCQSNNFDAQIADTTISMITYILLTLRYRYDNYESMGALYRAMNAEQLRDTLNQRIWELFVELLQEVAVVLELDMDFLIEKILTDPAAESLIGRMVENRLLEAG